LTKTCSLTTPSPSPKIQVTSHALTARGSSQVSCIYRRRLEVLNFEGGEAVWAPMEGKGEFQVSIYMRLPWMAPGKELPRSGEKRISLRLPTVLPSKSLDQNQLVPRAQITLDGDNHFNPRIFGYQSRNSWP
jgi:hypothetical protein